MSASVHQLSDRVTVCADAISSSSVINPRSTWATVVSGSIIPSSDE